MTLYETLLEQLNGIEYHDYFMACCVFHSDSKPSLMVHEDGFKCLACGTSGGLRYLAKQVLKGNLNESVKLKPAGVRPVLPAWKSWEEKFGDLNGIVERGHKMLLKFPRYQIYFKKRLLMEFAQQGKFGFISGWCLFPILDQTGKVIDIVVRSSRKEAEVRYVLHPDSRRESPYLYCPDWNRIKEASVICVVFGIVDSWALYSIGLPVVTGTSGKSLNPERLKELDKEFIIIPDKEEEKAAYSLANQLGWRGDVKLLKYPDECKDPDDVRRKFGEKQLTELIGDIYGLGAI